MVGLSNLFLGSVLVAAASLFSTTKAAIPSAAYVAGDGGINFALNIPSDIDSDELYFSMSGPSSVSWIAVGINGVGNEKMANSLIFMAYSDPSEKNVTVSPRVSYGNTEPSYTKDVNITLLAGTGIFENTTTVNAKCSNCRTWKGGSLNATNKATPFIWANGPDGSLNTKSLSAGVKRHAEYGTFQMDLTTAVGNGGPPVPPTASSIGTKQVSDKTDNYFTSGAHACVMVLAFLGLKPLAIVCLRIFNSPRFHGLAMAVSITVALIGAILGIYISTLFNRSRSYRSAHQIFGILIIIAMIGQFILGFMHHRIYRKTQLTTKLAPIHVLLGRIIIPAGILNGFLGFPLALNSIFNWALLALTLILVIIAGPLFFWRYRRNKQKAKTVEGVAAGGYQGEPWRVEHITTPASNIHLGQIHYPPPPVYGYGRS